MTTTPSIRDVALLLSCLPAIEAERVLRRLDPQQADAVRQQQSSFADSSSSEAGSVVRRFLCQAGKSTSKVRHHRIDAASATPPSFHFLARLAAGDVASLIGNELPQAQAAVLAQLTPGFAAEILTHLPQAKQVATVRQLALFDVGSPPPALRDLAHCLRQIIANRPRDEVEQPVGKHLLGKMLAQARGSTREKLTATFERSGPTVSDIVTARG